ncbi:uncharacterized protein V6R79_013919 [Siganus canaliculatus]
MKTKQRGILFPGSAPFRLIPAENNKAISADHRRPSPLNLLFLNQHRTFSQSDPEIQHKPTGPGPETSQDQQGEGSRILRTSQLDVNETLTDYESQQPPGQHPNSSPWMLEQKPAQNQQSPGQNPDQQRPDGTGSAGLWGPGSGPSRNERAACSEPGGGLAT